MRACDSYLTPLHTFYLVSVLLCAFAAAQSMVMYKVSDWKAKPCMSYIKCHAVSLPSGVYVLEAHIFVTPSGTYLVETNLLPLGHPSNVPVWVERICHPPRASLECTSLDRTHLSHHSSSSVTTPGSRRSRRGKRFPVPTRSCLVHASTDRY